MKPQRGSFSQDSSGLWHYQSEEALGLVVLATADALKYCSLPAWFWFNGTPAPIQLDDTPVALAKRWYDWRQVWKKQNPTILDILKKDAGI